MSRLFKPSLARATTCCSIGVRLSHPLAGRRRVPRPRRIQSVSSASLDEDWPDSDDFLGRIWIRESELGQPIHTQEFTLDEAHYTLHYRVREE